MIHRADIVQSGFDFNRAAEHVTKAWTHVIRLFLLFVCALQHETQQHDIVCHRTWVGVEQSPDTN